jgi:hypothetical protein
MDIRYHLWRACVKPSSIPTFSDDAFCVGLEQGACRATTRLVNQVGELCQSAEEIEQYQGFFRIGSAHRAPIRSPCSLLTLWATANGNLAATTRRS